MKHVMDSQLVRPQWREGPLAGWLDAFADWLKAQGYAPRTAEHKVLLAARFSRWLEQGGSGSPTSNPITRPGISNIDTGGCGHGSTTGPRSGTSLTSCAGRAWSCSGMRPKTR